MIISGSLLEMSPHDLATYSNREVIAVSQDPLGKQGVRVDGGELHRHALFAEAEAAPPIVRFDAMATRSSVECEAGSIVAERSKQAVYNTIVCRLEKRFEQPNRIAKLVVLSAKLVVLGAKFSI